jgi:polynucleotide 5'-triphosphatase
MAAGGSYVAYKVEQASSWSQEKLQSFKDFTDGVLDKTGDFLNGMKSSDSGGEGSSGPPPDGGDTTAAVGATAAAVALADDDDTKTLDEADEEEEEEEDEEEKNGGTQANDITKSQRQNENNTDVPRNTQTDTSTKIKSPISANKGDEDALSKLQKIKGKARPKRYNTPPIWAQEWIPPNRRHLQPIDNDAQTILSDKRVFDNTKTQSVDLECSITGVIPPPSVSRTIAEWIFANLQDIVDTNHKYVELELKFGTIIDKRKGSRINLNVATECVYTDHSNVRFDMQVEEVAWNDVCKSFTELESAYQDELRRLGAMARNKPKRKFNSLESDITDSMYRVDEGRNEHPKTIRVSKDNQLNPPRYTAIEKQRISHLYVHIPSSMYDFRLSLSLEIPVPETSIESIMARNAPDLIREKKRSTWTHTPTASQFDLTRVLVPRESKSKSGKKLIEKEQNFEIEIEINTVEVFNAIDKFKSNVDAFRFEELVEIFLNNARVLNNRVTKLAYK